MRRIGRNGIASRVWTGGHTSWLACGGRAGFAVQFEVCVALSAGCIGCSRSSGYGAGLASGNACDTCASRGDDVAGIAGCACATSTTGSTVTTGIRSSPGTRSLGHQQRRSREEHHEQESFHFRCSKISKFLKYALAFNVEFLIKLKAKLLKLPMLTI